MTNPPFIASAPLRRALSVPLLRGQQELVESLQLVVAVEVDLDPAALPFPCNAHLRGQRPRQPFGGRRDVRIQGRGSKRARPAPLPAAPVEETGHPLLGLADR